MVPYTSHPFGLGNRVWLLLTKRDGLIAVSGEYWGYCLWSSVSLLLEKDDLNTSLAGDAIGTLRRSSTMGFSIFRFRLFHILSVRQPTVRLVFVLTSVARTRSRLKVLILRQNPTTYRLRTEWDVGSKESRKLGFHARHALFRAFLLMRVFLCTSKWSVWACNLFICGGFHLRVDGISH